MFLLIYIMVYIKTVIL